MSIIKLLEPFQFGHFYPEFWFLPALVLASLWRKYNEKDPTPRLVNQIDLHAEYDFVIGQYMHDIFDVSSLYIHAILDVSSLCIHTILDVSCL